MLASTQSTSCSTLEPPTPAQRRRSPSSEPPTQDDSSTDGKSPEQYATMNELQSVVDTMEKIMKDQFGATRELLQGIEESRQVDEQTVKDALSRVEKRLASQEKKLEQTIEILKQSINSHSMTLVRRIQGLELLILSAEDRFGRIENALRDDATGTTAPATPRIETKRASPPPEADREPSTSASPGPSNVKWTRRESSVHPEARTPSSQPDPDPLGPSTSTRPSGPRSIVACETSTDGAKSLRREATVFNLNDTSTPALSRQTLTGTANGMYAGFAAWTGKEGRCVPPQASGSGTETEAPSARRTAAGLPMKEISAISTEKAMWGDKKIKNLESRDEDADAGEQPGDNVAKCPEEHETKPKQRNAQDREGNMKEAKSGKNADRAAAASSSDASAAVGLQRVISQTERCDIRPTTEESQGCRRSTRKRNREAGEETQPSAPSTEGSSKATNKRRKNSNGK